MHIKEKYLALQLVQTTWWEHSSPKRAFQTAPLSELKAGRCRCLESLQHLTLCVQLRRFSCVVKLDGLAFVKETSASHRGL